MIYCTRELAYRINIGFHRAKTLQKTVNKRKLTKGIWLVSLLELLLGTFPSPTLFLQFWEVILVRERGKNTKNEMDGSLFHPPPQTRDLKNLLSFSFSSSSPLPPLCWSLLSSDPPPPLLLQQPPPLFLPAHSLLSNGETMNSNARSWLLLVYKIYRGGWRKRGEGRGRRQIREICTTL